MTLDRPPRVFLLSPADCGSERARLVMSPRAAFPLAVRLRDGGAPLGDVMSFISGLYFRGKLAYARVFARPAEGVLVITPNAGLLPADHVLTLAELRRLSRGEIRPDRPSYHRPLAAAARTLAAALPADADVVLLGSIATDKYASPLAPIFGPRLVFPPRFVGIGDMSRGSILLRAARAGVELPYAPLIGAVRHRPRG
ncbi:MAG: hypothetical protein ACREMB_07680 [Candidatus Rokuibacteriota bacterium]